MLRYDDNTLMPFGQHKGKPLGEVPAGYLLYIDRTFDTMNPSLKAYIEDNRAALEIQASKERKEFFKHQKQDNYNRR